MAGFLRYAVLRSLYVLLALAAIWGSLLWGPWLSLPLAVVMLHLVTYVERWTGPSPPDLVAAPAWFGRWLSHPEDSHGLVFCGLHFAAIASAFWLWLHPEVTGFVTREQKLGFALGAGMWLGWSGGINMGINFHSLPRLHEEMKPELIAGGAHVVPYGIYRASSLLNSFFCPKQGWERFLEQHPEYLPAEQPVRDLPG